MAINKSKITAGAQKYASKGQLEKAIVEYQKILKVEPDDIRTCLKIGDLYTKMGQRGSATNAYLKVASQYRKSGFHLKAVAVYKQILKLDPLLANVYEMLGDAYISLGLTSEALIQFEQLADLAKKQGKNKLLLDSLFRIINIDENNIPIRIRIGEQIASGGDIPEAVKHLTIAANQLKALDRYDDYLKVAERIIFYNDSNSEIIMEAARLYIERSQPKRALGKLQIIFSRDRNNTEVLEMLSRAFIELGQTPKAISVYKELINIFSEKGDTAQKQRICRLVLSIDPQNTIALKELGSSVATSSSATVDHNNSLPSPAAASGGGLSDQASASNESELDKLLSEADVLVKYGLVDRAREHFAKIFKIDFYNMDAREQFKDLLLGAGDKQGAKEQLFALVDGFKISQPEGAVYYLHKILEIDPYSRRARDIIMEIGGLLPEGLPALADDVQTIDSAILTIPEVDNKGLGESSQSVDGFEIDIDDIPYIEEEPGFFEEELDENDLLSDDDEIEELTVPVKKISNLPLPRPSMMPLMPPTPSKRSSSIPVGLPRPSLLPKVSSIPDEVPGKASINEIKTVTVENVDLDEEIEEIEFFIDQELYNEAKGLLDELLVQNFGNPELEKLKVQLDAAMSDVSNDDISGDSMSADDVIDADSIDLDTLGDELEFDDITEDTAAIEVDEVFDQFKAGVEKQVARSDHNTHFDLGQAYKDMGLWNDAIGEFKIAGEDDSKKISAELMVGMCLAGAGRMEEAIETFNEILEYAGLNESEKLTAMYEKGKTFELMGKTDKALDIYNDILAVDPGFADVVDRIDLLE
ncbi:MAG: tetratricopeptide repeat protein [Deltaproteobacteria bacterium]|nr:tetratricopeptide repeat protein [Deltaproteobacteria bacterium]